MEKMAVLESGYKMRYVYCCCSVTSEHLGSCIFDDSSASLTQDQKSKISKNMEILIAKINLFSADSRRVA